MRKEFCDFFYDVIEYEVYFYETIRDLIDEYDSIARAIILTFEYYRKTGVPVQIIHIRNSFIYWYFHYKLSLRKIYQINNCKSSKVRITSKIWRKNKTLLIEQLQVNYFEDNSIYWEDCHDLNLYL